MLRLQTKIRFLVYRVAVIGLICLLHSTGHAQTWLSAVGIGSGTGSEQGRGACTDAAGNVYYIGQFTGSVDFDPGGGITTLTTPSAFADAFITKYNAAGQFQWARRCGGVGTDVGAGIATDGTNIYAIGNFANAGDFGPFSLTAGGGVGTDVWVAKLDGNGNWLAAVNYGAASSGDAGQAVCTDPAGNVYISGTFTNSLTIGSTTLTPNGDDVFSDMFVARLSPALAPVWASGGGAAGDLNTFLGADNAGGSGIVYVPGINEIVVVGSYNGNAATYGGITIPNSGGNEIVVLEINANTGAFLSAIPAGGSAGTDDEAVGVCYDAGTGDVFLTGYFSGNITFPGTAGLTGGGQTDLFAARYDPEGNNFIWAAAGGGTGLEEAYNITNNGQGSVVVAGQFTGTVTFGSSTLTSTSATVSDPMVAAFALTNGSKQWAAQGSGNGASDDFARGITTANATTGVVAVTGQFNGSVSFGSNTVSAAGGVDIFFATLSPPPPLNASITASANPTCDNGCNGSATVTATGGTPPYTYAWSPSGGTAATATGLCAGNYTVTVTDNAGASVVRNVSLTYPAVAMSNVNASNVTFIRPTFNTIADGSCRLIATVVPNSTQPVNGNTSGRVWIEPSVPIYPAVIGLPYVARHYEITPANNTAFATARVTMYFSQAEFTAFNAHPLSFFNLPTGPGDASGIANLRIAKYPGTSSDNSGRPGSYSQHGVVLNPDDADIVWNATANRWEVSLNVNGFSGFIVQTHPFVLPVNWLKFLCFLNGHSRASLSWEVEEWQVADYTVEKSTDGTNFSSIGVLASKGNGEHSYSFTEGATLQGNAFYRIRQTDIDGRVSYSKIILLKSDKAGVVTAYPNPTRGVVTLNVTKASLFNTDALLHDAHGRQLQVIRITESVMTIDLGKYSAGMYLLRMQHGITLKLYKE